MFTGSRKQTVLIIDESDKHVIQIFAFFKHLMQLRLIRGVLDSTLLEELMKMTVGNI